MAIICGFHRIHIRICWYTMAIGFPEIAIDINPITITFRSYYHDKYEVSMICPVNGH